MFSADASEGRETRRPGDWGTRGPGDQETGEAGKAAPVVLTDEEKLDMKLLAEKSPVELNELKGQTGLSNKKWDTAIKGLRKHNLTKVEKNEEGLFVSML